MKRWIPFVAWLAFVCGVIVCADTGRMRGVLGWVNSLPLGDKAGHFVLIGTMAHLLNYALRFRTWSIAKWPVQRGGLVILALITVEEVSQIWIPSRTFDAGDLLANTAGVLLAELAARKLLGKGATTTASGAAN